MATLSLKSQHCLCLPSAFALMPFLFCVRTRTGTKHDLIPISCLNEFPNAVQMAKVRFELACSLFNTSFFKLFSPLSSHFPLFYYSSIVLSYTSLLHFHLASLISLLNLPWIFCLKGLLTDNYKKCLHSHVCSKLGHMIITLLFPSLFLTQQLLCEDVNVERFFPVLYPKV